MLTDIDILQRNLTTLRKRCGWTVDELADILGYTQPVIYNLEDGTRQLSVLEYIGLRTIFEKKAVGNPFVDMVLADIFDDYELESNKWLNQIIKRR